MHIELVPEGIEMRDCCPSWSDKPHRDNCSERSMIDKIAIVLVEDAHCGSDVSPESIFEAMTTKEKEPYRESAEIALWAARFNAEKQQIHGHSSSLADC